MGITQGWLEMSHSSIEVHPDYNDNEANLILVSGDSWGFRVHSLVMTSASEIFKTMIDVAPEQVSPSEVIHIPESRETVKGLLDIIYNRKACTTSTPAFTRLRKSSTSTFSDFGGKATPAFGRFWEPSHPSFEQFKELCYAAEKYEMSGVLESLQSLLQSTERNYPVLPAYALASRYEWKDALRSLSTRTLSMNLLSLLSTKDLFPIPSDKLIPLLELHRERRDSMVMSLDLLDVDDTYKTISPYRISLYSVISDRASLSRRSGDFWSQIRTPRDLLSQIRTPLWQLLECRLSEAMEECPDGSLIQSDSFWDREEFRGIWAAEERPDGSSFQSNSFRDREMLRGIRKTDYRISHSDRPRLGFRADDDDDDGCDGPLVDKHKLKGEVLRVLHALPRSVSL